MPNKWTGRPNIKKLAKTTTANQATRLAMNTSLNPPRKTCKELLEGRQIS